MVDGYYKVIREESSEDEGEKFGAGVGLLLARFLWHGAAPLSSRYDRVMIADL